MSIKPEKNLCEVSLARYRDAPCPISWFTKRYARPGPFDCLSVCINGISCFNAALSTKRILLICCKPRVLAARPRLGSVLFNFGVEPRRLMKHGGDEGLDIPVKPCHTGLWDGKKGLWFNIRTVRTFLSRWSWDYW